MVGERPLKVSVVIPVYGGEQTLPALVEQIESVFTVSPALGTHEVILVYDCSPDRSWEVIEALCGRYASVRGIRLRVNAGQHNAVMAGLTRAVGEIIVTMDDDLQHSPADIPALLEELARGRDVVFARFRNRQHSLFKRAGSWFNNVVAGFLMKKPKGLYLSPFRALKASIKNDVLRYKGPYVYLDGLILSMTRNVGTVEVQHHDRYAGTSGYSFRKLVSLWLKMATNFSIVPLRVTSLLGLLFAGLGFVFAALLIAQKFLFDLMPIGWSSLIVTILIIGGVQLLALGMLGEYLGRVLLILNAKPQYVIDEVVGFPGGAAIDDRTR